MALTCEPDRAHFEPFVHLVDVDDDQALFAWGGFWFVPFPDGHGWRTVDDEELHLVDPGRTESIGARSASYGPATVRVFGPDGRLAGEAHVTDVNHAWVRGLRPDTPYRYEIEVDGHRWDPDEPRCWHRLDDERGELRPAGRRYDLRFRTFPDPTASDVGALTFAALGDYGIGIQAAGDTARPQIEVARVLDRLVAEDRIALVLTLGDNIYLGKEDSVGGSGGEDDDWYFSFYEPYRFVIARVPLFPAVGNHDTDETERSDDRDQIADNHFTDLRFMAEVEESRGSVSSDGPGLFYRFGYGRIAEFCCIDSSEATTVEADRYFDDPSHQPFLDETFPADRSGRPAWLIPYLHHPAYCAGPYHGNDEAVVASLVPRFRRAGVRLVLAAHEHNFQHSVVDGIDHFVSGAAGKLRPEPPEAFAAAHTRSWAAEPHLLVVTLTGDRATVWPVRRVDDDGELVCVDATAPDGRAVAMPLVVTR